MNRSIRIAMFLLAIISVVFATFASDAKKTADTSANKISKKPVVERIELTEVKTLDQMDKIFENAGDTIQVFKIYAEWCGPCKMLTPVIEHVAYLYKGRVKFYRVDADKLPQVQSAFGGGPAIPQIVFVRNRKVADLIVGYNKQDAYTTALDSLLAIH